MTQLEFSCKVHPDIGFWVQWERTGFPKLDLALRKKIKHTAGLAILLCKKDQPDRDCPSTCFMAKLALANPDEIQVIVSSLLSR